MNRNQILNLVSNLAQQIKTRTVGQIFSQFFKGKFANKSPIEKKYTLKTAGKTRQKLEETNYKTIFTV